MSAPGQPLSAFWDARYRTGRTPWDTGITPPEVQTFWQEGLLPPQGLALDMGCGTGTNSLFLARLGLRVLGFDISLQALLRGKARWGALPEAARVQLVQADVSRLPLRGVGAVYGLDVGCLHGVAEDARYDYAKNLALNVRAGGYLQIYAFHRRSPEQIQERGGPPGLDPEEVLRLFSPAFRLLRAEEARPEPFPAHWYLLQRR